MEPKYFNSIPRLSRNMTITEKLDGTNGVIELFSIEDFETKDFLDKGGTIDGAHPIIHTPYIIRCLSRNIILQPEKSKDNAGFCHWVFGNLYDIINLGPGSHAGEWWGQGIQRNYGLKEKRFSLFAVHRWIRPDMESFVKGSEDRKSAPACCHVVPMIFSGPFDTNLIDIELKRLANYGSYAAPDFMKPEGIIIYHEAAKQLFKKTIEKDEGKNVS
jgi:hypothetical protein